MRLPPQDLKTSGPHDLKITLPVEGMTCAACQATVQRALTEAPGVTKAAVNLMTNEATVTTTRPATDPARWSPRSTTPATSSHLPAAGYATPPKTSARAGAGARIRRAAASSPSSASCSARSR